MTTGNVDTQTIGEFTGKVKWFNNAKGYGFIIADGGDEDMFAHYSSITMEGYKTLKAGQSVAFDTKSVDNGTHAINISAIEEDQEAEMDNAESNVGNKASAEEVY